MFFFLDFLIWIDGIKMVYCIMDLSLPTQSYDLVYIFTASKLNAIPQKYTKPGGYNTFFFPCSTQLSMKFSVLINMKMPSITGIFIFISREIFMLRYVQQEKKSAVVCNNLRFISRTNFMLSWVEHDKSFITSGPGLRSDVQSGSKYFALDPCT